MVSKFQPHIIPVYPPHNELIFEEWFAENYKGCNTDRELLPFFPTSYWVNNNYAQDAIAKQDAQDYIDSLPNDKKWFVICQYDDGVIIDWKGKDVLEFNMSKNIGVQLPLLCQPHPYKFTTEKWLLYSFVGSNTHPIRETMRDVPQSGGAMMFDRYPIEKYCEYLSDSIFGLCPRGYGLNSFRIAECVQYGAIPVYISDEFIIPTWMDFESFGVLVNDASKWYDIICSITPEEILYKQKNLSEAYEKFYTYEANLNHIIKYLENEQ
jgi:hypothetical protein